MNLAFSCRFCDGRTPTHSRRSFLISGAESHYAPDQLFQLVHLKLEVSVDPRIKKIRARAVETLLAVSPHQKKIRLDQKGLTIRSVKVDGKSAPFQTENHNLWIELEEVAQPGATLTVDIEYEVTEPQAGLYFTGPIPSDMSRPYQVWSQGQDEDNHHWIPILDSPNQKTTTEVIATVPSGFTAISNGALLSKKEEAGTVVFHYKMNQRQSVYLISLVVGEFDTWTESLPSGLPVEYYVERDRLPEGKLALSCTPRVIEVFQKKLGIPFPFEKYSQVTVQDFIFGGMENSSATTLTDRILHDRRAHLDFSANELIAHELAHQWFGDLVTCRDWSHGWLNEGFATFLERVWLEEDSESFGSLAVDEAKYHSMKDLKDHLHEDRHSYRRPIVCNTFIEPIDLFDTHLYQKGGLVLHLIRCEIGEVPFWNSVKHYLNKHQGQSVETLDLIRSIEEVTGKNLRKIFDQWVFGAGIPELEITWNWDEKTKTAELQVEQKQTDGKDEVTIPGAVTPLFDLDVRIDFHFENAEHESKKVRIFQSKEKLCFQFSQRPEFVRFDSEGKYPKTLKFPRPDEMLIAQLVKDPDSQGRIEAAHAFSKPHSPVVIEALASQLLQEPFWGVQAEIAATLGNAQSERARDALIAGLKIPHPKARRAIVQALGKYRDLKTSSALRALAEKDPSYNVEAEAIYSYAKSRHLSYFDFNSSETSATEEFLLECLKKDSFDEVIRASAFRGLADLPGVGQGARPEALKALFSGLRSERPIEVQVAAAASLAHLIPLSESSVRKRIIEAITHCAQSRDFRLRYRLVKFLTMTECREVTPVLEMIYETDHDPRVRRSARLGLALLAEGEEKSGLVLELKEKIDRLEESSRRVQEKLDRLEARLNLEPK